MAGNFDIIARLNRDPEFREFVTAEPLFAFSVDTAIQAERLHRMACRLDEISESWIEADGVRVVHSAVEYRDLFWFWVLGAYEVVRTMSAHRKCFSTTLHERIEQLKTKLARIRVPFAKQELRGKAGVLVNPEATRGKFAKGVIYEFDGHMFDSVELLAEVRSFFFGITICDILQSMHWKPLEK